MKSSVICDAVDVNCAMLVTNVLKNTVIKCVVKDFAMNVLD